MSQSGRRLHDSVLPMQVQCKSLRESWLGSGYTGAGDLRRSLSTFDLASGHVDKIMRS